MQARIQLFWKPFVKWVIVISVIRWARANNRIAQSNKALQLTARWRASQVTLATQLGC
jgi:hypothetical protein